MTSSLGVVVGETLTAERGGFVILAGSINFSVNNVCSLSPLSFKEITLGTALQNVLSVVDFPMISLRFYPREMILIYYLTLT